MELIKKKKKKEPDALAKHCGATGGRIAGEVIMSHDYILVFSSCAVFTTLLGVDALFPLGWYNLI